MSDELDIIPVDTADSYFFVNGVEHNVHEYLDTVSGILTRVEETEDYEYGLGALRSMVSFGSAVGWGVAKLMHGLYTIWQKNGHDSIKFLPYLRDIGCPYADTTVNRYIEAWQATLEVPVYVADAMKTQPIKNAIAIGKAIAQGYAPEQTHLQQIVDADKFSDISKVVRDMTGRAPRKNSLTLYIDKDTGDIFAYDADGGRHSVGFLSVQDAEENSVVDKAIKRIVRSSGMIER